jgi:pSer/pThr/pTyr-binding forkhead associated (FHA) protein
MTQLVVMLEKQIIKRLEIKSTSIALGRHPKSDIQLPDRTISTHHARITVVRDDCFLEDLSSTNGTYVNYQQVERHLLEDGDMIGLGKYQIFFQTTHGVESQIRRLSVHPRLLDKQCTAWLKVLTGRKSGHCIPLHQNKVVLGNDEIGFLQIEYTSNGYIACENSPTQARSVRNLHPGDELSISDVRLQFIVGVSTDATSEPEAGV